MSSRKTLEILLNTLSTRQTTIHVDVKGVQVTAVSSTSSAATKFSLAAAIPSDWYSALHTEIARPYFARLSNALAEAYASADSVRICPRKEYLLRALRLVSPDRVRVVILGTEPHCSHCFQSADGLAFSSSTSGGGTAASNLPPSLTAIVRELERSYANDFKLINGGDLSGWAAQGVLLLNMTLSVIQGEPRSHAQLGWRALTDRIIQVVAERAPPGVVFLLWGAAAQEKSLLVAGRGHHVLRAAYPLKKVLDQEASTRDDEVGGAFFGCNHFVRCNQLLAMAADIGMRAPIEWGVRRGGSPLKHPSASANRLLQFAKETTLDNLYANVASSSSMNRARAGATALEIDDDDEAEYSLEDAEEESRRLAKHARIEEI